MRKRPHSGHWFAFIALVAALIVFDKEPASATIYDVRGQSQLKLTSKQKSKVRRINSRSARERNRILRKHGINPSERYPLLEKIMRAANELQALGRRTRLEMSKILKPEQMRTYDRLVSQTRARVTKAVMSPPRVRRLRARKAKEQAAFERRQRRKTRRLGQ